MLWWLLRLFRRSSAASTSADATLTERTWSTLADGTPPVENRDGSAFYPLIYRPAVPSPRGSAPESRPLSGRHPALLATAKDRVRKRPSDWTLAEDEALIAAVLEYLEAPGRGGARAKMTALEWSRIAGRHSPAVDGVGVGSENA